ncbi:MAG TPA: hypothetical protein VK060_01650 [Ruania sp.]|nr:hypothetical protein [Ruania sp.]
MPTTTRPVSIALTIGLLTSAVAAAVPLLDLAFTGGILAHVRSTYPGWEAPVAITEAQIIAGWLAITQALGVLAWLLALARYRRGRTGQVAAVLFFTLGGLAALLNLTVGFGDYDRIVPTGLGALTLLPVLVGAVALVLLRRHRQRDVGALA